MMAVIGDNTLFFDQGKDSTGKSNDTYTERYFADETLVHDASAKKFTLTDSTGDQFVFNDFTMQDKTDQTKGLYQRGGLISYTAADGATATVNGHTTLGNISEIDIGNDKYIYTYNTAVGQVETLKNVQVKRGGNVLWNVDYTYYQKGNDNGTAGDLQSAVVSMNGTLPVAAFTATANPANCSMPSRAASLPMRWRRQFRPATPR